MLTLRRFLTCSVAVAVLAVVPPASASEIALSPAKLTHIDRSSHGHGFGGHHRRHWRPRYYAG
jgi:hypothetical protein